MSILTAIDLCCGAGGWIEASRGLPIQFLAAVDWAEDCCLTVQYNHPGVPVVRGDVTKLPLAELRGRVDLVLGAIPCEEISVLRASRPAKQEQIEQMQALLDGMLDLVELIDTRWWVFENVIQMRRHLRPLTPHVVLNSKHWSGQDRERIFVGKFPVPPKSGFPRSLVSYIKPGPHTVTKTILRSHLKTRRQWYSAGAKRVLDMSRPSPTITDFGSRHSRGFVVETYGKERVLTLQEAALLMGFPEDYVFVSAPSRAFKLVAQAVQVDLARAILTAICEGAGVHDADPS